VWDSRGAAFFNPLVLAIAFPNGDWDQKQFFHFPFGRLWLLLLATETRKKNDNRKSFATKIGYFLNLINEFVATSSLNLKRLSNRKKITWKNGFRGCNYSGFW
jgi:hypothetical protein